MKNETCIILIDGSNFYFKLKDLKLHNLLQFNFFEFCQWLAAHKKLTKATYYIGKVRTDGTDKIKKLHADQQKLFSHLPSLALIKNCNESRLIKKEDLLPFVIPRLRQTGDR
ncbi:NYN domain-containing protein [Candidatus Roizmanbacteria bacterium]|nr:NYN domain-containing protein [Candidatus Roizmanbacteria bacterium]